MLSFILFRHYCRNHSAYPPTYSPGKPGGIGRAALQRWHTWHFSMQGLPFPTVACRDRGLLPHVFTITLRKPVKDFGRSLPTLKLRQTKAVIFCGTVCSPSLPTWNAGRKKTRLFTGTLPYAVQTFLPDQSQDDSPVCSWRKYN